MEEHSLIDGRTQSNIDGRTQSNRWRK